MNLVGLLFSSSSPDAFCAFSFEWLFDSSAGGYLVSQSRRNRIRNGCTRSRSHSLPLQSSNDRS